MDLHAGENHGRSSTTEVSQRAMACLSVCRTNRHKLVELGDVRAHCRRCARRNRVALDELCDCVGGDANSPATVHSGKFSPRKPCPDGGNFKV